MGVGGMLGANIFGMFVSVKVHVMRSSLSRRTNEVVLVSILQSQGHP